MTPQRVRELDQADPLAAKRTLFNLPDGVIYLDGNSLGALPHAAAERISNTTTAQWGQTLIDSWNTHDWINLPQTVGEKIAPLLGAGPQQVIACDSISVNLFKLLCLALALQPGRTRILSDSENFPTDLYMAQGVSALLGEQRCELITVSPQRIQSAIDDNVAVVLLTHVDFRSGRLYDMAALTKAAHAKGALVLWDLAHSAGAMPLQLDQDQVDMAVGCGYKYLNGGPGAPAYIYLAKHLQNLATQPLSGWMGHADGFAFEPSYTPAAGLKQMLTGTPAVLSMSALDAALTVFDDLDLAQVRDKSIMLAELFIETMANDWDLDSGTDQLQLVSPPAQHRGSHIAFSHPQAYAICQALKEQGVVTDYRAPDLLRVGFAPLYNSYQEVWLAAEHLRNILRKQTFHEPRFAERQQVT